MESPDNRREADDSYRARTRRGELGPAAACMIGSVVFSVLALVGGLQLVRSLV